MVMTRSCHMSIKDVWNVLAIFTVAGAAGRDN